MVGVPDEPLVDIENDERFQQALESILDLVVIERAIRDTSGAIVDFEIAWMNNAPVDVARRSRDEMVGRRISDLYPALAGGELIAGYREVVESGEPLIVPVLPYEDVIDGKPVSGFYTVQATKFGDGVLVASRDITPQEESRVELERALDELGGALQELETAQRLARLGTWRVDLAQQSTTLSGQLQRIFGLPGEVTGEADLSALWAMIHADDLDAVSDAHDRAMQSRGSAVVEHRVVRGDGTIVYVRTYTEAVVAGDEVVGLWGTTQDIGDIIASRLALQAETGRRVTAEAVAELAEALARTESPQDIANAVHLTASTVWELGAVVVGVVEDSDLLHLYYAGSSVPVEIKARYMRTPLSVDTHMTRVVNEGRRLLLSDQTAQRQAFPRLGADLTATEAESGAVLPLVRASGEVFGALAFAWPHPREFDRSLTTLLDHIAELASRAAERQELRELERSVTQTLQEGLLAIDVRSTRALVRARYRAADASMHIGGDWYDAVVLEDDRVVVAVGDVVGHGLSAATTMGQLRAALAVTAMQARDPAEVVRTLDQYARRVPGGRCTTAAIAIVDPAEETMSYVSAGHPPPLLVDPDGSTRFLEGGRSWPLGIDVASSISDRPHAAVHELPSGSLLLLYTDGLIERRHESIEEGLARLQAVVEANWNLPLRRLKEAIFAELVTARPEAMSDDVALVALRMTGASRSLFAYALHARPDAVRDLRQHLQSWCEGVGLDQDDVDGIVLATAEAVANGIDHGSSRDESQIVRVEAAVRDNHILVSISDAGQWRSGVDGYFSGRGRGHLLMQGLADDVDIDTDAQGTIVTLRFPTRIKNSV